MTPWVASALVNHVWQSTLFVAVVWLATRALRSNRARMRYWLWTAASVKFLIPMSALVSLGAQFEWRTAPAMAQPAASFLMEEVLSAPAVMADVPAMAMQGSSVLPWLLLAVWLPGFAAVLLWWWRQWIPIRSVWRAATALSLPAGCEARGLTVMSSSSMFEPGVFGIWRPRLLLPDGLVDRLTIAQLNALIAHERCHVRCHDNLAAAMHMAVEAMFWFHPLVWWIESRMIEERERACDEAVLRAGSCPADYAEGILTVCRWSLGSPVMCVSGVTGADLRARIETIMANRIGRSLNVTRRLLLAAAVITVVGVPIVSGVVNIEASLLSVGQEPSTPVFFEVAAVKPNRSGQTAAQIEEPPGGRYIAINASLRILILRAYEIPDNQLVGAPEWTQTERFDVNATLGPEPPAVPRGQAAARRLALRSLLAERFKLVVHRETRQFPMYALVMARADGKPGPRLTRPSGACSPENAEARAAAAQAGKPLSGVCGSRFTSGRIQIGDRPLSEFARGLSGSPDIGRGVTDRTGLTGNWDLDLTFTPDRLPQRPPGQEPPPFDPNGPSLFTALQEQLGLKLESIQGPMEVLVVDRVERLSEN